MTHAQVASAGHEYRATLTAGLGAPQYMRRIIADHLGLWGVAAAFDDVCLVAVELVTNVYRHAEQPTCALQLQHVAGRGRVADQVWLTVSDRSDRMPVRRPFECGSESGRGLLIVAELADGWDVVPTSTGKDVRCWWRRWPDGRPPAV